MPNTRLPKQEPKFKVGDKVKALKNTPDITKGNVYVVTGYKCDLPVVEDDVGEYNTLLNEAEWELVANEDEEQLMTNSKPKFKVGDIVKALRDSKDITKGNVYVVTGYECDYPVVKDDVGDDNLMLDEADWVLITYIDKELELMTNSRPKFNIGDRVMWRDPLGELKRTYKGTVASGNQYAYQVCIRFDEFPDHTQTHHESYIVHLDSEDKPGVPESSEGPFVVLGIVPNTVTYKSYNEALEVAKSKATGYPHTSYVIVSAQKVFKSVTEVREMPLDA